MRCGARAILRRHHQDRRAQRHVGPLLRSVRAGLGGRRPNGGRGFRRCRQGHEGRDRRAPTTRTSPTSAPTSRAPGSTSTRSTSSSTCRPPRSRSPSTRSSREKNKVFLVSGAAASDLTGRSARPTPCTGPTTPGRWPTAPARPWSRPAAIPGSSSPPTMRSARRSSATPPRWSWPTAARCSAACVIRSPAPTSRRSCCRRRPPRPRSSASPTPAATRSTRSSRRPSSASPRAGRASPACWSSSPTCTRSACRPRRAWC